MSMLILIIVLLLISFLWALFSLREMRAPSIKKAKEQLQKGRVIFYASGEKKHASVGSDQSQDSVSSG